MSFGLMGNLHKPLLWVVATVLLGFQTTPIMAQIDSKIEELKAKLAVAERTKGENSQEAAMAMSLLARALRSSGQLAAAESFYLRTLAINEKSRGSEDSIVANILNNLAGVYQDRGNYAAAEPMFKRAIAIIEKVRGPEHSDVGTFVNNLATLYEQKGGQYAAADALHKRALAIYEKSLGREHPLFGNSLGNIGALYFRQGQYVAAEPILKRALVIMEKSFGPMSAEVATILNNLAELYRAQGQFAAAEPLYERSLVITRSAHGPEGFATSGSLRNLAQLYLDQEKYVAAETLFKQSLAINERFLGAEHGNVALDQKHLATVYFRQGQYAAAEPLFKRALVIMEKFFAPDDPEIAKILNNLAATYHALGQYAAVLPLLRRSSALYRKRILLGGAEDSAAREAVQNRDGFLLHLKMLAQNPLREQQAALTNESFEVMQLKQSSGTGNSIAKMAARFSKGDDALATLVKRQQDGLEARARAEASLVRAVSVEPARRDASNERQLRDTVVGLERTLEGINSELRTRFPNYEELTRPAPLAVREVQALLRPAEAMVAYELGDSESYAWVIQTERAEFIRLDSKSKEIEAQVKILRGQMEVDDLGRLPAVDVKKLYDLYRSVFGPVSASLGGIKRIMLVPGGALQSLPFSMLVATPPPPIKVEADYRAVDWLAKRYGIAVLPTVSSIRALRKLAKANTSTEPFVGFGDPVLTDDQGSLRGKNPKVRVKLAGLFRQLGNTSEAGLVNESEVAVADVNLLRRQASLPETADELKAMAGILGGKLTDLWLRDQATETRVKSIDLSKYRKIAFATHGVTAGGIGREMEAGLILTPPKQGTVEDDGYLTASEIAKLNINAEWVLLSACNTAAPDGSPGAEGLSGLAKAFFYAGARSLLVSHWPVFSDATVSLTTAMLKEFEANPVQGKAEAQRKAMLSLMNTPDLPEYAHPAYWAPFVVVGEGGMEPNREMSKDTILRHRPVGPKHGSTTSSLPPNPPSDARESTPDHSYPQDKSANREVLLQSNIAAPERPTGGVGKNIGPTSITGLDSIASSTGSQKSGLVPDHRMETRKYVLLSSGEIIYEAPAQLAKPGRILVTNDSSSMPYKQPRGDDCDAYVSSGEYCWWSPPSEYSSCPLIQTLNACKLHYGSGCRLGHGEVVPRC
jgi:CHAT domain-containing protein/tetratricopeptide (TPR) repeat protein